MYRVTEKQLNEAIKYLNKLMDTPVERHTFKDGKYRANIGNYHLDCAYGGYMLVQTVTEGGGIRNVSNGGYGTKRELLSFIHAYRDGILAQKERCN